MLMLISYLCGSHLPSQINDLFEIENGCHVNRHVCISSFAVNMEFSGVLDESILSVGSEVDISISVKQITAYKCNICHKSFMEKISV